MLVSVPKIGKYTDQQKKCGWYMPMLDHVGIHLLDLTWQIRKQGPFQSESLSDNSSTSLEDSSQKVRGFVGKIVTIFQGPLFSG